MTTIEPRRVETCPFVGCTWPSVHQHGTDTVYAPAESSPAPEPRPRPEWAHCGDITEHLQHLYGSGRFCPGTDHLPLHQRRVMYLARVSQGDTPPTSRRDAEMTEKQGASATSPSPTKVRAGDQALPVRGVACVQDLVIARMEESKRVGLERYGSTLMTFNGRRGIQDVAEEVRDLFVYLTQIEEEAKASRETLVQVVAEALASYDDGTKVLVEATPDEIAQITVDRIMGWVVGQQAQGQGGPST